MTEPDAIAQLRNVVNRLVAEHAAQAANILGFGNIGMEPQETRDMLVQHVIPFVDLSAEFTAQWYEDLDPGLGFSVVAEHQVEDKRIERTASWALFAPGDAPPLQRLLASAQRMIYDGSRHTVITNADRESALHFRHAPESACTFCRLLTVKPSAYEAPHTRMPSHDDDCECLAVPARPGHKYRHPGYVRPWVDEVRSANTDHFRSTIAGMHRNSV